MAELSFGEKLLIARKQLDLYQYEMAERLGVHPNSIWKYERARASHTRPWCGCWICYARSTTFALTSTSPQLRET